MVYGMSRLRLNPLLHRLLFITRSIVMNNLSGMGYERFFFLFLVIKLLLTLWAGGKLKVLAFMNG